MQHIIWSMNLIRTVCIYLEDGNEMNNTISENVGICNRDDSCGAAGDFLKNNFCSFLTI